MTTEKQIAANRRNALKSTGPRTSRGKAFTSLNRLYHGLRAVPAIPRDANLKELAQIRAELMRSWQPQTTEQHRLVEQMATAQWLEFHWQKTETRVLSQDAGTNPVRAIALMDQFSLRQARYQRAFMRAYQEYRRSTRAKRAATLASTIFACISN